MHGNSHCFQRIELLEEAPVHTEEYIEGQRDSAELQHIDPVFFVYHGNILLLSATTDEHATTRSKVRAF